VREGDTWRVGPHVLLCVGVITGWPAWVPHLDVPHAAFCPFPGPFVPFGAKASALKLVMVQPDPYIAGHILARYGEVHGVEAVELLDRASA
jgi:hypothetical protein